MGSSRSNFAYTITIPGRLFKISKTLTLRTDNFNGLFPTRSRGKACVVNVPWASSLRQYRSSCPNILLYWEAIRWGCDHQFALFDFGRSTKGEGTYKFKMQWGSVEETLHWQCFSANIQNGPPQTEKNKYAGLVSLWTHLPVPVTKPLGPWIRKQISL